MVGKPGTIDDITAKILDTHYPDKHTGLEVLTVNIGLGNGTALEFRLDDRLRVFIRGVINGASAMEHPDSTLKNNST